MVHARRNCNAGGFLRQSAVTVVLIALLALLLLGEQLDLKAWLGVVLMAIGAALVAWV